MSESAVLSLSAVEFPDRFPGDMRVLLDYHLAYTVTVIDSHIRTEAAYTVPWGSAHAEAVLASRALRADMRGYPFPRPRTFRRPGEDGDSGL